MDNMNMPPTCAMRSLRKNAGSINNKVLLADADSLAGQGYIAGH